MRNDRIGVGGVSKVGVTVICGAALAGCFLLPGDVGLPPVEADRRAGAETAKQAREQIGLYEEGPLDDLVRGVGSRLVARLEDRRFDFELAILDQEEPNAFAAQGGYIFVSRGLLAMAASEDELATVIGHEIIHVTERHAARSSRTGPGQRLLRLPGRIVGGVVSENLGRIINAPLDGVGQVFHAKYSRGQESEADRLGLALAAESGYEPGVLADILARMERWFEASTGTKRRASVYDTHPATPQRIAEIDAVARRVEEVPGTRVASGPADFLKRLDGIVLGENPARGVFRGARFLHPDLDIAIDFPEGWRTVNTAVAAGAVAPEEDGVVFLSARGEDGDPEAAGKEFARALERDHRVRPSRAEPVAAGASRGYLVAFDDRSTSPPMTVYYLWVRHGGVLFQLVAAAPERHRERLRATALSLGGLTAAERASIEVTRLRLVAAGEGETLRQVAARSKNALDDRLLEVYNGAPLDRPLAEGAPVKVAVREAYRSPAAAQPQAPSS